MTDAPGPDSPSQSSSAARMSDAIRIWMIKLESTPGWTEYRRQHISYTIDYDHVFYDDAQGSGDFRFSPELAKQYAVVTQYLGLVQTYEAQKACEYYFRRYPFDGLPMSRIDHFSNVCEMYCGRIFELKERIKKYLNAVKCAAPSSDLPIGNVLKAFESEFAEEIRARNSAHHRSRFSDLELDRAFLNEELRLEGHESFAKQLRMKLYRNAARAWVARIRSQSQIAYGYLEEIAEMTLGACDFL